MGRKGNGGKRLHSSTSDFDSSTSFLEEKQSPVERKNRKKKKTKTDKQQKLDHFFNSEDPTQVLIMEKKLDEINGKLANMLTKDDTIFIRRTVKETLNEIKDNFLESVLRRLDILEGEIHTKSLETERLNKELKAKNDTIDKIKEENETLKKQLKNESSEREKADNDNEQYGRRNNIRISGIPGDVAKQQSAAVATLVVKTLNEKGGLNLQEHDIDISHRLGKWVDGKNRTVIVRFVRRQTKINVMRSAKNLKTSKVFVNEDLTYLNQQVLSSLRLKDKNNVTKCWSFEGKIFATFRNNTTPTEIKFRDYRVWLDKPWPRKT